MNTLIRALLAGITVSMEGNNTQYPFIDTKTN